MQGMIRRHSIDQINLIQALVLSPAVSALMCFQSYVKDGDFERAFPSYRKPLQRHTEFLDSEDYEVRFRADYFPSNFFLKFPLLLNACLSRVSC